MTRYKVGDSSPKPLIPPCDEQDITKEWSSNELVVSIICQTYQHVSYIKDALDGFLAQKTNFRFEIIVRDDCSEDGTSDVVKDYAQRYPNIIKGIYEPFNKWPAVKPGAVLRRVAKGKYVAECEGDDYWIDPFKLQKQIDYLDSHTDVVLLKTNSVWIENGVVINPCVNGGTRTHVFRNSIDLPLKYLSFIYFGDTYYQAMLKSRGIIASIDDVTAVWRKHSGGVFGDLANKNERVLNVHRSQTQVWIAQQFFDEGNDFAARKHMAASFQFLLRTMTLREIIIIVVVLVGSKVKSIGRKLLNSL